MGDAPALVPGGLISLTNHPVGKENQELLVVRCQHSFGVQDYRSTAGGGGGESYTGSYEFQPSDRQFRAPLITPKPSITGPQTAKVVGAEGEEIDVDEDGRILVHFHWDRFDDKSCRVRIAQNWAGSGWGSIHIPRIGQEVLVDFLNGDPDQPIVRCSVYNGEKKVPYQLPANKTKAGFKSNSSKGGSGFNEIVLEDKKDAEEIGLHAQKDLNVVVLNQETWDIAEKFTAGTARKTTVHKGDDELKISTGNQKVDIALDQDVKAGKEITLEANAKITLKVGGSKIEITPAGIKVVGTATVDVQAGAKLAAKGGIITLN